MSVVERIDRRKTAPKPSPELEGLLVKWRASQEYQGRSERTITERAAVITRYEAASGEAPRKFTAAGMTQWVGRSNLSMGTRWTYAQALRAWHLWLQKQKLRKDNPTIDMDTIKQPKSDPRPIEDYQLEAVLRAAHGRDRMMVLLAAYVGLRVHEIAKVDGRDFDAVAGTLRVTGKGGKKATVVLHPTIVAEAANYPAKGPWFPNGHTDPKPVTRQHVSRVIREALEAANLDATAHALRHTFATSLVNADVDMLTIQKLMRHSSPTSTTIYADVSRVRREAAINRLTVPTED